MDKRSALKDYLRAVLDAELNCYTCDCAIDRFEREKRKYQRHPTVKPPALVSTEVGDQYGLFDNFMMFIISAVIGFAAMGIIIGMIFDSIKKSVSTDTIIFLLFGVPIIAGIAVVIFSNWKAVSDAKKRNEYEMEKHRRNRAIAEQQIKEDAVITKRIEAQINQMVYVRSMAYQQRRKLYDLNIIHTDYRELTKISKMYEYIDTGICYELEGGLGAYAKCREEMIWGSLYDLLVDIKNDLSELKGICYSLYAGITETNRKLNNLCEGMNETLRLAAKTEHNTAIAAYNSEIAANESRIQTNMMIYSTLIK